MSVPTYCNDVDMKVVIEGDFIEAVRIDSENVLGEPVYIAFDDLKEVFEQDDKASLQRLVEVDVELSEPAVDYIEEVTENTSITESDLFTYLAVDKILEEEMGVT